MSFPVEENSFPAFQSLNNKNIENNSLPTVAQRIGHMLAEAREKHEFSIEDISARLKVSAAKLRALEAGEWDKLPALVFIQGIVRSYARLLGIDPDLLIAELRPYVMEDDTVDKTREEISTHSSNEADPAAQQHKLVKRKVLGFILTTLIIIILCAVALFQNWDQVEQWTNYFSTENKKAVSDIPKAKPPVPVISSSQVSSVPPVAPASLASASASTAQPSVLQEASKVSPPIVMGSSTVMPASQVSASAPASENKTDSNKSHSKMNQIHLKLSADCWIEIRQISDGKIIAMQTFSKGTDQQIEGIAPLKVLIGNIAGVTSFEFDGKPIALKSKNNVAQFFLPLKQEPATLSEPKNK